MANQRTDEGRLPLLSTTEGKIEAQRQERRQGQASNTAGLCDFLRKSYDFLCNMSPEHKVRFVQVILGITVITCLAFIFKELSEQRQTDDDDPDRRLKAMLSP